LRHDRRGPRDRHAHERLRLALAAVLGLPVIALVIGQSLARRLNPGRPGLLTIGLLAGTFAVSALSSVPIDARSVTRMIDRESLQITMPRVVVDLAQPVRRPVARSSTEHLHVTPASEAPTVVRFRPRAGWTGVSRFAAVSVRFTRPMDHASTETAFRVVVGQRPIGGTVRWAEGDTVLVLTPASALPYGARVSLSVEIGARAEDGARLAKARSVTFTVQRRAATIQRQTPAERPAPPSGPIRRSSAWRWPLIGPITQRFGESLTQYGFHYGIDIDGSTGDPVRATRRGRVVVAGHYDQCGGLEVHIDHGNGIASWYRHLSRIQVDAGAFVEAGTIIGRVGDTGCSLGSHLHFAIRKGSRFVDPLDYLPPR
jgi:murein DD-endopeptidase MepM/ murein hydrolase activator NlpD